MNNSQPGYSSYNQPASWSQWPQTPATRPYPSQYISRQNSQASSNSAAMYSQYATGYAQTCPLPQAESPHPRPTHTFQMRPKSMSWPRGIFSPDAQVAVWNHQDPSAGGFYPDYRYHTAAEPYARQKASVTPMPHAPAITYNDPESSLSAALYDFHTIQSPDVSTETLSHLGSTPPSSLHGLSYQSTPVPAQATLVSLPAQSGLLGLNCHFGEEDVLLAKRNVDTTTRGKIALKKSHIARPVRNRRPRPTSAQAKHIFRCDFCHMKFDRKSNLKDHLRTHNVDKKHVPCYYKGCQKVYGRKADVNRHVKSFHEKDSVCCEHCGKEFVRSDSLTRHNVDNCRRQKEFESQQKNTSFSPTLRSHDGIHQAI